MHDNQHTAVLACMSRAGDEMPLEGSERLLARACEFAGVSKPTVTQTGRLLVARKRVELPPSTSVMTVLHVVAHLATPRVFPAHGAEFCDNMLSLSNKFAPWTGSLLQQEFERSRVHFTADHRRKAVLKAVMQREVDGTEIVEVALDDPPEVVVGGPLVLDRKAKTVSVGKKTVPLTRLRYVAKVR